ncbi:MAG: site-specific integrase [Pseudomonadota bacterium]
MPLPSPPRTYLKNGVYYIRLFVPKRIQSSAGPNTIVCSLRTKDHKAAFVLALKMNLQFEKWAAEMTSKGIVPGGDALRGLTVVTDLGDKMDFDLKIPEEKQAYDEFMALRMAALGEKLQRTRLADAEAATSVEDSRKSTTGDTLLDVFKTFKISKSKTYAEATQNGYFPKIERFIEFCAIKQITRISQVRKDLAVEFRDLIDAQKDSGLTVDSYTNALKQFFVYAIGGHKYNFSNPFNDLGLVSKAKRKFVTKSWLPFSDTELKALFLLGDYKKRFKKPDLFYSPIISLTMGLRLEELCQPRVNDIYRDKKDGIWVFDINMNSEDKEVKTEAAKRKVPLSAALLSTDFLQYHAYVKSEFGEDALLYPYLIKTKNGYSKNLGYNFTEHKRSPLVPLKSPLKKGEKPSGVEGWRKVEADAERKTFHSLRKNFGYAMSDADYGLPLRKKILGHEMGSDVTTDTYSGDITLPTIQNRIDALDTGIDFSKYQLGPKFSDMLPKLMVKHKAALARQAVAKRRAEIAAEKRAKTKAEAKAGKDSKPKSPKPNRVG